MNSLIENAGEDSGQNRPHDLIENTYNKGGGVSQMQNYEITIVGAGLAGITAARRLKKQGRDRILLVDKSTSVGGRLATRRVANGKADHGAQFFTVRTDELNEDVEDWLEKGWIRHWYGEDYPRYTAVDGMNRLAKQLSEGFDTLLQSKVVEIKRQDGFYKLIDDQGKTWKSEKVLLTMPVPQVVQLMKDSQLNVPVETMKQLKSIAFEPTYVGIFHFQHATSLPGSGQVDQDLPDGMERIVDHQKKEISDDVIVSIYMTGDWSRRHYGEDYVMGLMKEKAASYLDFDDIQSEQLKRWRYAQANKVIRSPYLDLTGEGTLVCAGDAFLRENDSAGRTRFESAYLSGKDAAAFLSW
ncbi:FAD-dependent oxidoreductase [Halobacillus litoralis]|uniref:NAD(P)/FAD-dependent oxidoreductase n=1 Tax=Halobacillus litoralis TaxID=45668 RepID=UPI001CD3F15E|nr:FAD-dependent oxidoreductase [Halobacillus litoralis]MCA0971154.1 FAD-dependent oxidoreductase [Halobacillus litoralis]